MTIQTTNPQGNRARQTASGLVTLLVAAVLLSANCPVSAGIHQPSRASAAAKTCDRSIEVRVSLSTARSRWDATKDCVGSGQ
jgi:hypothetical protein